MQNRIKIMSYVIVIASIVGLLTLLSCNNKEVAYDESPKNKNELSKTNSDLLKYCENYILLYIIDGDSNRIFSISSKCSQFMDSNLSKGLVMYRNKHYSDAMMYLGRTIVNEKGKLIRNSRWDLLKRMVYIAARNKTDIIGGIPESSIISYHNLVTEFGDKYADVWYQLGLAYITQGQRIEKVANGERWQFCDIIEESIQKAISMDSTYKQPNELNALCFK